MVTIHQIISQTQTPDACPQGTHPSDAFVGQIHRSMWLGPMSSYTEKAGSRNTLQNHRCCRRAPQTLQMQMSPGCNVDGWLISTKKTQQMEMQNQIWWSTFLTLDMSTPSLKSLIQMVEQVGGTYQDEQRFRGGNNNVYCFLRLSAL